jgi:hypothetical protein|tara:strand:+ start:15 stop:233 length:219 start_codon:yes stop_codon:yes gene_type:complete
MIARSKMTKSEFEEYLFELNDFQTLDYTKHNDYNYENNTNKIIHLYYNDNGHIGTWQRGGNYVVFEKRLPKK